MIEIESLGSPAPMDSKKSNMGLSRLSISISEERIFRQDWKNTIRNEQDFDWRWVVIRDIGSFSGPDEFHPNLYSDDALNMCFSLEGSYQLNSSSCGHVLLSSIVPGSTS